MTDQELADAEARLALFREARVAAEDAKERACDAWYDQHKLVEAEHAERKLRALVEALLADRLAAERRGQEATP
jgi:hypothetical protein